MAIPASIKVIIDLGGNNGMSALFFHKKYPDAIIYVLEPDKANFEILQRQTKNITSIVAINKAIWKENGFVKLDSGDSWAIKVDMESGANLAEAITMQTLMENYKINQIDLLKIDIESAEKELFEADTLFLSKTRNLVIELHDWLKPGCAESFFNAINGFSYNYTISRENTLLTDLRKSGINKPMNLL